MGISPESIHKVLLSLFSAMLTSSSHQLSCPKEAVSPFQFVATKTAQGGALMADLLDTQLEESESETHVELNFAVLKLKHIRKRKK